MQACDRITQDPGMTGGKACMRVMRVTVGMLVAQIGTGHSIEELLNDCPYLKQEDVLEALRNVTRCEPTPSPATPPRKCSSA
jgi:uncharacterized protein (DUF433 family)